jgi:hypothetical protein
VVETRPNCEYSPSGGPVRIAGPDKINFGIANIDVRIGFWLAGLLACGRIYDDSSGPKTRELTFRPQYRSKSQQVVPRPFQR